MDQLSKFSNKNALPKNSAMLTQTFVQVQHLSMQISGIKSGLNRREVFSDPPRRQAAEYLAWVGQHDQQGFGTPARSWSYAVLRGGSGGSGGGAERKLPYIRSFGRLRLLVRTSST